MLWSLKQKINKMHFLKSSDSRSIKLPKLDILKYFFPNANPNASKTVKSVNGKV